MQEAKVSRPRGRPRADSRLEEVLSCAAALFSTRGYAATTLEDIAGQLGMTRPGLYYYADSKEALLEKCYVWTYRRFQDRLEAELGEGTGRELLSRFFLIYAEMVRDDASRCFLSAEHHYLREDQQATARQRVQEINARAAGFLAKGVADGSLAQCDMQYALATLFGAFNALTTLDLKRGVTARDAGQSILSIVLNGLAPRP